jgi:flagellar biosynthesis/type III secretory pathway M-ring protein FliF/YscJ
MNKELKMLLISIVALVVVLLFVSAIDSQNCETVVYQNLSGEHSERVCEWEK